MSSQTNSRGDPVIPQPTTQPVQATMIVQPVAPARIKIRTHKVAREPKQPMPIFEHRPDRCDACGKGRFAYAGTHTEVEPRKFSYKCDNSACGKVVLSYHPHDGWHREEAERRQTQEREYKLALAKQRAKLETMGGGNSI